MSCIPYKHNIVPAEARKRLIYGQWPIANFWRHADDANDAWMKVRELLQHYSLQIWKGTISNLYLVPRNKPFGMSVPCTAPSNASCIPTKFWTWPLSPPSQSTSIAVFTGQGSYLRHPYHTRCRSMTSSFVSASTVEPLPLDFRSL